MPPRLSTLDDKTLFCSGRFTVEHDLFDTDNIKIWTFFCFHFMSLIGKVALKKFGY